MTAHRRHRFVLEDGTPILWTLDTTAFQLSLHQRPSVLSLDGVCVIVESLIELSLQDTRQFSVLDVASDSDADFSDENYQQENGERQNHPAGFTQCTAAAEERDYENHRSDDHENDRRRPERFADKVLIMMIRILNDGANDNGEYSGQLKVEEKENVI